MLITNLFTSMARRRMNAALCGVLAAVLLPDAYAFGTGKTCAWLACVCVAPQLLGCAPRWRLKNADRTCAWAGSLGLPVHGSVRARVSAGAPALRAQFELPKINLPSFGGGRVAKAGAHASKP